MPKKAKSRPARKIPRQQNDLSEFTFSGSPSGSQSFTTLLKAIRSSCSLKDAIGHLDLTFQAFGRLLGHSPQFVKTNPRGFSKSYLSMLVNGDRPMSTRMLRAIEWVIHQTLTMAIGEEIGVRITRNSPWHFCLAKVCERHGPYELKGNRKHCPICKMKMENGKSRMGS